jgi:hypothetical protein
MMKTCDKCKTEKSLDNFCIHRKEKDGLSSTCRSCTALYKKEYYSIPENKKRIIQRAYRWNFKKREEKKIQKAKWASENAGKIREERELYLKEKAIKNKIRCREWYHKNKERSFENTKKWIIQNKEKYDATQKKASQKALCDPTKKLNRRVSIAIYRSLNGAKKNRHWEGLVPFTLDELKTHLEKRFTPEMTWENYGSYWHIDHRIPKTAFNFQTAEDIDFRKCWALKNLQPLEGRENISKGNRLVRPFQPSLLLVA